MVFDYSEDGPDFMLCAKSKQTLIDEMGIFDSGMYSDYMKEHQIIEKLAALLEKPDEELMQHGITGDARGWPLTEGWGGMKFRMEFLE